jgi:hypothetical protein
VKRNFETVFGYGRWKRLVLTFDNSPASHKILKGPGVPEHVAAQVKSSAEIAGMSWVAAMFPELEIFM